ncbi:YciI family protein [Halomonas organivorans]|uniref:Putative glyoxalase superfamily protein PhnB n=1 Tax=Halomonas organivorans TaxID=257772 RepID=A0A7W5BVN4_9GAMM|nr:YciI family protein [Halomonas organivorans]MBB3139905.1 putative glyoxalase superfamily protein PhnB [Halomonas organivorans]
MRYMLMRKADAATEEGVLPSQELLQAMGDYNERMIRAGVFVTGDGLRPSREGCRIEFRGGEPHIVQGPFAATEELLAGYSVLEVDSLEDAIEWAKDWPREDGEGHVTLELRRYFTMQDFEPGAGLERHVAQARLPRGLQVHLTFPGNCREAMAFYAEVTGGHLEAMLAFGETPAAAEVPAEWHDRIAHASLNVRGHRLMGADMMGDCYQAPQGAQVFLDYEDVEQAAEVFRRLAEGGQVQMPFEATFWAKGFGMATDRFGVHWMVSTPGEQCP